jgi:hypothetical protein
MKLLRLMKTVADAQNLGGKLDSNSDHVRICCVYQFSLLSCFLGNLALCVAIINSRDTEWRKVKVRLMLLYLTSSYHDMIHAGIGFEN